MYRLLQAVYVITVFAIATSATWAASLLPISSQAGATAACIGDGCFATTAALAWLPYPCPCHRKDS